MSAADLRCAGSGPCFLESPVHLSLADKSRADLIFTILRTSPTTHSRLGALPKAPVDAVEEQKDRQAHAREQWVAPERADDPGGDQETEESACRIL